MLKFQPSMLNDEVCRMATDKQTHKYTHTNKQKTYIPSKDQKSVSSEPFKKKTLNWNCVAPRGRNCIPLFLFSKLRQAASS